MVIKIIIYKCERCNYIGDKIFQKDECPACGDGNTISYQSNHLSKQEIRETIILIKNKHTMSSLPIMDRVAHKTLDELSKELKL